MEESTSKRASRACDACKIKRMKCDRIIGTDDDHPSCRGCRELGQVCQFNAPVRKRGPAVGFKRRREGSSSDLGRPAATSPSTSASRGPRPHGPESAHTPERVTILEAVSGSRVPSPSSSRYRSRSVSRAGTRDVPLLGLPRPMIDELLIVYFTHVHNVWPLIYKPTFSPYTASPLLLLSMLAISSCVSPSSTASGFDARKLYRMAESALHRSRMENRIDVVQALILLSLTQTGCGDKGAAFIYASRAVGMILNMGLNLARKDDVHSDIEQTRARVLWNCYVLDKSLAEETGRSYLLPYRRCSTPFPSTDEADELEVWPPTSTSSAPLPRCLRRLTPRRGYIISCFVWTCRLAMVVEDILNLDSAGLPGDHDWDRQFRESAEITRAVHGEEREAERIGEQLNLWRGMLPEHLVPNDRTSPLPHHVIGLAWHATAMIMLHSRFVVRVVRPSSSASQPLQSDLAARSHRICSSAAQDTVQMLRSLDKHGLLEQISSDAIHILSLATLFDAFDMTDPDITVASRAKEDFAQCCAWLRHFSSMWPAASAHKLFFEAVIQGGLKLADPEAGNDDQASPLRHMASLPSPSLTGGLQAVRRHLSVSSAANTASTTMPIAEVPSLGGASGMLQLPHFFWNHLSTAAGSTAPMGTDLNTQDWSWNDLLTFDDPTPDTGVDMWANAPRDEADVMATTLQAPQPNPWSTSSAGPPGYPVFPLQGTATPSSTWQTDQAAISAALMSFMADMTKT